MVHLVPSISFLVQFKSQIEKGMSVSNSLEKTFEVEVSDFSLKVQLWWLDHKVGRPHANQFKTHLQRAFIEILEFGLKGGPIYDHIVQLEQEMNEEFEIQWKAHLESLPSKLSIPLLLFFFPAYVILLFGPLITMFLSEVSL